MKPVLLFCVAYDIYLRVHLGVKILCGGDELDVMVLSTVH